MIVGLWQQTTFWMPLVILDTKPFLQLSQTQLMGCLFVFCGVINPIPKFHSCRQIFLSYTSWHCVCILCIMILSYLILDWCVTKYHCYGILPSCYKHNLSNSFNSLLFWHIMTYLRKYTWHFFLVIWFRFWTIVIQHRTNKHEASAIQLIRNMWGEKS